MSLLSITEVTKSLHSEWDFAGQCSINQYKENQWLIEEDIAEAPGVPMAV